MALIFFAGCGPATDQASSESGRWSVVATTGMIADLASAVGGDRISVTGMMGPGVDPHLYKASAGDVRRLASADLVLYNGIHLEAAMAEVLEEMDGRVRTVAVARSIPAELLIASPQFKGSFDPHVWFDVALWSRAVSAVEEALIELDPGGADGYRERAQATRDTLTALEDWVRSATSALPPDRRVLITAHDAFGYFGRAYGFEVVGLQGISTATEAGTADVQHLVDFIVDRRIPAVFVETSVPPRTIEAVQAGARARGFAVRIGGALFSDAMGSSGTVEGTYPGMVRHNVRTIVSALGGGS
jgi:manganese/zinc/iron transport system substrate-binding protein